MSSANAEPTRPQCQQMIRPEAVAFDQRGPLSGMTIGVVNGTTFRMKNRRLLNHARPRSGNYFGLNSTHLAPNPHPIAASSTAARPAHPTPRRAAQIHCARTPPAYRAPAGNLARQTAARNCRATTRHGCHSPRRPGRRDPPRRQTPRRFRAGTPRSNCPEREHVTGRGREGLSPVGRSP